MAFPNRAWSPWAATKYVIVAVLMVGVGENAGATTFSYPDFSNTSELVINGDAASLSTADGNVIRLSPALAEQSGSFFTQNAVNVTTFSTSFTFRITNPGGIGDSTGEVGADGLVFVVQPIGNTALGLNGLGMGYGNLSPSLAVEFDTFKNSFDPDSNHVGIDYDGNATYGTIGVATRFDDGNKWFAWIDYDGATLEVRANQTGVRPALPLLSAATDLTTLIGGNSAFVGFTAATFSAWGDHDILSWDFVAVPEPSSQILAAFGLIGLVALGWRRRRRS